MDEKESVTKTETLDEILSELEKRGELTVSDKELLKLRESDHDLTIVESADSFSWPDLKGRYYDIIARKDFDKAEVSDLDEYADLLRIDIDKLAARDSAYYLDGDLAEDPEYEVDGIKSAPNFSDLKKLKLSVKTKNGKKIDLSPYRLAVSGRIREFYSVDKGLRIAEEGRPFNSTSMIVKLHGKDDIAIVYRKTYYGSEEVGSRLYLKSAQHNSTMLDKDENADIISFMDTLEYIHKAELKETSCSVSHFGRKRRGSDYRELYA